MTGCAYGVDTETIAVATKLWPGIKIICAVPQAPHNSSMVAFLAATYEGEVQVLQTAPKGRDSNAYMARNTFMSERADELAAFPPDGNEELRSGTWSTIRRFKTRNKPAHIFPFAPNYQD